jgi:paraquat-inducible protein B
MTKENMILFLVAILIFAVLSAILFHRNIEGFYSNTSTSSAKTTINDLLSNQLNTAYESLKDMNSNKYNLDLTSAISSLGEEMKNSSDTARNFIKIKKDELSVIQKNLNRINEQFTKFAKSTLVEQAISTSDPKSIQTIPIMDAFDKITVTLKRISNELGEIPE